MPSTLTKQSVSLELDNGTTSSGSKRTLALSIGELATQAIDEAKVMNIANALALCLSKDVLSVINKPVYSISED